VTGTVSQNRDAERNVQRVLFYNDTLGFGGHEIMALMIMESVCRIREGIYFACSDRNDKLFREASAISGLRVIRLPLTANRYSFVTNIVCSGQKSLVARTIREIDPACIVAIQGVIDLSSLSLLAARKENRKVITYIALAQSMKELGVPDAACRDFAHRHYYYKIPDKIITISETQKSYLLRYGLAEEKVSIIPNVVRTTGSSRHTRSAARSALGIDAAATCFGLVGRVVINHKGHDYLVEAVHRYRDKLEGIVFLIAGSGEDLDRVRQLVAAYQLGDRFFFTPWTDDTDLVYAALDAVVMPSNHEGVPLVMIEAGLHGLPVVASDIDGMQDYLPAEWLFARGDLEAMAEKMAFVAGNDQAERCLAVKSRFERIFLRTTIGEEFVREIEQVVRSSRSGAAGNTP